LEIKSEDNILNNVDFQTCYISNAARVKDY